MNNSITLGGLSHLNSANKYQSFNYDNWNHPNMNFSNPHLSRSPKAATLRKRSNSPAAGLASLSYPARDMEVLPSKFYDSRRETIQPVSQSQLDYQPA